MKHSLSELVSVILQRIEDQPGHPPTESGLRSWLARQGYAKRDIEAAIKLVRPRIMPPSHLPQRSPVALRHLSVYEAMKLSPEARDALVRLELYELLDTYEREMILERLGQFEGEVGMDELDYILSWVLYSTRDVESQQTIYNVFEGGKGTVH